MKTLQKFAVATLCAVFFIPFAEAQSVPTPEQMLPANIDIVVSADLTQPNPFTPLIEAWEEDMVGNNVVTITEDGPASPSEDDILFRFLTQKPFTFAMNTVEATEEDPYPMPDMYLFGDLSDQDFEDLIASRLYEDEEPTSSDHNGTTIYEVSSDMYIFQYIDIDVVTSSLESAQTLIDTYENNGDSLSKKDFWQNSEDHITIDGFVSMYVDPAFAAQDLEAQELFEELGLNKSLIGLMTGEIFRLGQTEDGFDFQMYVEGDQDKLEELDMEFDKYNFTPSLYKTISGNNIILYTENNGANEWKEDFLKSFSPDSEVMDLYNEMVSSIEEETGINIDEDLFPYLGGKNMIAVHNSEQLFPAITAVFESNSGFKDTLNELNDAIADANLDNSSYQQQLHLISGQYFVHHMMKDPEFGDIDLWLGMTSDNLFVISTHHELNTIFRAAGNMTLNEGFAKNFEGPQDNTSSLFYMDFENLADYVAYGMTEQGASEEELQEVADMAAPWHNLYLISFADGNQSWANGSLGVNHELLAQVDWEELLFGPSYVYDDYYDESPFPIEPNFPSRLFCDVHADDWFYTYVTNLSDMDIVSGYSDGCFRPNDPVTRAEFVKMFIAGLEAIDWEISPVMTSTPAFFSDVSDAWYTTYVNEAAANSLINGYPDDTFRPNNSISRAEAMEVLFGLTMMDENPIAHPFTDVLPGDWFNDSVTAMYDAGIISGKTPDMFDPHANITRAEAAKVINLYLDYLKDKMDLETFFEEAGEIEEPVM
ncbi:MAG: S-layer homology domain-containing protein [Candidatus Gracilibacteria bacterium]